MKLNAAFSSFLANNFVAQNWINVKQPLVKTTGLTKRFGDFTALDSVDLSIDRGTVFGLLGPNGAGKSTLIRVLMGFLRPTNGTAEICGLDCHHQRVAAHHQVAYLPGDARMFRLMRGHKALKFFCELRPDSSYERGCEIAERFELDLNRWVGFMSTGMRQKLALAVVMSTTAPLLILDEPTANLDPTVRGSVIELIREAKDAGRTVMFSSHVLPEIEEVCDVAGILRAGKLVHLESMSELKRQHRIDARILGEMPPVPEELADELAVRRDGDRLLVETPGELSPVLRWLASAPLDEIHVHPVGLRAVYDRFHHPEVSATAVSSPKNEVPA